jgi:hypothetical protein
MARFHVKRSMNRVSKFKLRRTTGCQDPLGTTSYKAPTGERMKKFGVRYQPIQRRNPNRKSLKLIYCVDTKHLVDRMSPEVAHEMRRAYYHARAPPGTLRSANRAHQYRHVPWGQSRPHKSPQIHLDRPSHVCTRHTERPQALLRGRVMMSIVSRVRLLVGGQAL